ncbi:hypothetical protein B0H19DRAFT_188277 [Mycena capillaripes]|nr:hypothetical protein B0H19DRAFT_188277 [Mycena capillaripes]
MAFQKPHIVDLSKAIRLTDLRLNDILAQHAERLGELDAEDPTPPPHPAYASMLARPSPVRNYSLKSDVRWLTGQALALPGFTPDRLKRPRPSSPALLATEADAANEEGAVDSSSNSSLCHGKKKKSGQKNTRPTGTPSERRSRPSMGTPSRLVPLTGSWTRPPCPRICRWKHMTSLWHRPGGWADETAPSRVRPYVLLKLPWTRATAVFKNSRSHRDGCFSGRKPSPSQGCGLSPLRCRAPRQL